MLARYWKECELYLESADIASKSVRAVLRKRLFGTETRQQNAGKVCSVLVKCCYGVYNCIGCVCLGNW